MQLAHECQGPCNAASRRARYAFEDAHRRWVDQVALWERADPETRGDRPEPPEEPSLRWTPGDPVWCRRCAGAIRAALADLDTLAAMAAAESDGHRGQRDDAGPVRGSRSAPSPSPAADLLDELYGYLARIEADWREHRGWGPRPERSRGASAMTQVVAWLGWHLDEILANPGSVGFGLSVLRWQRLLQARTRSRPEGGRKPLPCPRCDRRTLIHEADRGLVRCENPDCCRVLSTDEYDEHVNEQAGRISA